MNKNEFINSLKQLPMKRTRNTITVFDWVYSIRAVTAFNTKTREKFSGSLEEFLIEKKIWDEELLAVQELIHTCN